MRDIDLIPIRLHKGDPTWEIIDELLEHIDSQEENFQSHLRDQEDGFEYERRDYRADIETAYEDGYTEGYSIGIKDERAEYDRRTD